MADTRESRPGRSPTPPSPASPLAPAAEPRDTLSPASFLLNTGGAFIVLFGLVWLWVVAMPLAFLDPEYPSWLAKQHLLAACDIGEVLILGDSRAAAGVMPLRLPVRATNLAVGGGEAIEALAAFDRAMACPSPPKRLIVSLDAVHFTRPDLFWERTARFGFLDGAEIATLRRVSHELGDVSVYELRHTDGLPSWLRDAMYRVRFPSLYVGSLLKGGVLLRWPRNRRTLEAGLAARGHYVFGTAGGSGAVAADGNLRDFRPLPVLAWYFDRLLAQAGQAGVRVDFVAVPMNEATARQVDPEVHRAFRVWLAIHETRYPGFHVLGEAMPHWPDRYFGDGFAHLNPEGAARFSSGLGLCLEAPNLSAACVQRLQAAPPNTQNEAQYGWFKDTGPDASAKVAPSSKRGS